MIKEAYHPKAYLSNIKNIRLGLRARTRILNVLDKGPIDAKGISIKTGMHYRVVTHHLRLLGVEGIIESKQGKPHIWSLTGLGQKRLESLG
jgi:predicted transcriptional regulator